MTQSCCFNCDSAGGGFYRQHEGETVWHLGLTSDGQAQYACTECAPLLFNCLPIDPKNTHEGSL